MNISYRKLKPWKYQTVLPFKIQLPFTAEVDTRFIGITEDSMLIEKGYAWDGPSGPTIDTPDFMRGSLVHDALYQLLRMGELPPHRRLDADNLLRDIIIADGMPVWRAWYVYKAVRWFGKSAAAVVNQERSHVFVAPPRR